MSAARLAPDGSTTSLVLTQDAHLRRRFFGDAVMMHPAKQSLKQLIHLLDRFAVPGGLLVDVFGGSGTAMLACSPLHGAMYVATIELASHFVALQQQAWDHFRQTPEMAHFGEVGDFLVLPGDAREAATVLYDAGMDVPEVDLIVTSPPYQDTLNPEHGERAHDTSRIFKVMDANARRRIRYVAGYDHRADLIVTSPPYQDAIAGTEGAAIQRARRMREARIANGAYKRTGPHSQIALQNRYDVTPHNIGNERGEAYLASMRAVWQQCWHILKPGGILCCITRDCVRDKRIVPVANQNRDLISAAGLTWLERETWHIESLSFWRRLHRQRFPDAPVIQSEYVDIFQKPEAA